MKVLSFSNLLDYGQNTSFSNTIQFDLSYSLSDRFDIKMAYKFNDAKTTYPDYNMWDVTELKEILLPKQRGLANLIYSNLKRTGFDATFNYIGRAEFLSMNQLIKSILILFH